MCPEILRGQTDVASQPDGGVRAGLVPGRQRGMGLVGAVFLIVVVSLLGLAMSRMLATDAVIYSYEILSLKAFYTAESGAQLGANRVLPPTGAGSCSARTFTFQDAPMASCEAVVACAATLVNSDTYYTLTSVGTCTAGDTSAVRTVQVRLKL